MCNEQVQIMMHHGPSTPVASADGGQNVMRQDRSALSTAYARPKGRSKVERFTIGRDP